MEVPGDLRRSYLGGVMGPRPGCREGGGTGWWGERTTMGPPSRKFGHQGQERGDCRFLRWEGHENEQILLERHQQRGSEWILWAEASQEAEGGRDSSALGPPGGGEGVHLLCAGGRRSLILRHPAGRGLSPLCRWKAVICLIPQLEEPTCAPGTQIFLPPKVGACCTCSPGEVDAASALWASSCVPGRHGG